MIKTKKDLQYYLKADWLALGKSQEANYFRKLPASIIIPDYIWSFQKTLRVLEYLHNQRHTILNTFCRLIVYRRFLYLSHRLNFSIPVNVFGPGLAIAHWGTIIVNGGSQIGANCRINACVVIGAQAGTCDRAPIIGNNVYIGPGAKVYGDIAIADDCVIGANAVVNKSFAEPGSVIAGIPAKIIGKNDCKNMLIKGTSLIEKIAKI